MTIKATVLATKGWVQLCTTGCHSNTMSPQSPWEKCCFPFHIEIKFSLTSVLKRSRTCALFLPFSSDSFRPFIARVLPESSRLPCYVPMWISWVGRSTNPRAAASMLPRLSIRVRFTPRPLTSPDWAWERSNQPYFQFACRQKWIRCDLARCSLSCNASQACQKQARE